MPPASTEANYTLHAQASYKSIPGHPRWGLAPLSMAWQGKSLGEICRQIKDKERNGGRDLALLQEHAPKTTSWHGAGSPAKAVNPHPAVRRKPGQLTQAWIDTGAECP